MRAKNPSSSLEIFGLFFSSSFCFINVFFFPFLSSFLLIFFLSLFLLIFFEVKCVVDRYKWHRPFQRATTVTKGKFATAAMLVFQNKGMAAMMVNQTNPPGIELYFYANTFLCFSNPIWLLVT